MKFEPIPDSLKKTGNGIFELSLRIMVEPGDLVAVVPPAPEPPAPPPAPGLLPSIGNTHPNRNYAGPTDMIDAAKIPAPIPFNVFADAQGTIAPSMQGAEAKVWRKIPLVGVPSWLYEQTPQLVDGKIERIDGNFGDDPLLNVMPRFRGEPIGGVTKPPYPLRGGPRGQAIGTPYTAWHGHSPVRRDGTVNMSVHLPLFVGVVMDGTVMSVHADGSMKILMKIDVPKGGYLNDFTYYEPREANIFFVVNTPLAQIWEINRGNETTPHSAHVVFDGRALGHKRLTSIRAIGEWLYVCDPDMDGGGLWRWHAISDKHEKVAGLAGAFWVDFDSKNNPIVITLSRTVHRIQAGMAGPDLLKIPGPGQSWVNVSVDRNGTCGEVDSIIALSTHGRGNVDTYRITSGGINTSGFNQGSGGFSVGSTAGVGEALGHYPWNAEYHPFWALVLVQGFAECIPGFLAPEKPGQTWWGIEDPRYEGISVGGEWMERGQMAARGLQAWIDGGVPADKGKVPSFTAQLTPRGMGLISFDHIAEMSYAQAAAFIRGGMLGSWPRNIPKATLMPMMYWAYRHSQRFLREGRPLVDGAIAYCNSLPS